MRRLRRGHIRQIALPYGEGVRRLVFLLGAAVLGLAGCGGGSKSTSTAARTVAAATVGTTSTPTTTSAKAVGSARKKDQSHRTSSNAPPANAPPANAPPAKSVTAVPSAETVTNGSATSSSPSPVGCLNGAGLVQARLRGRSLWSGYDPASHVATVNVVGPMKSRGAANSDAHSRGFFGIAQPAGRYVVSATPPSNLDTQVHLVAKCLGDPGASTGSSKPVPTSGGSGSTGAKGGKGSNGKKGSGSRTGGNLVF